MTTTKDQELETRLLLEAVRLKHGYDFSGYSKSSLKRRIQHVLSKSGLSSISEMIPGVLHDMSFFNELFCDLIIHVTELFRDPGFYLAIRKKIVPVLKTYPYVNVWVAGCSTGEEAYSMAILLQEEGLSERTRIYATDINDTLLQKAEEGIYPASKLQEYAANYRQAGGKETFSDYYHLKYDRVRLKESLSGNIVFSNHNLVTDAVFAEMNMVLCRNVLIYFNRKLQERALGLFLDSLIRGGFLCMGNRESMITSKVGEAFAEFATSEKIYKKKAGGTDGQ